jgi:two-component system, cell cycle response regulator DivK
MPKILLVEDNQDSREGLTRRLERRGYEVVSAGDGRQGVEMARSASPDLILMDINLPEIDGWEATRLIRSEDRTRNIPIIALTAHALTSDRQKTLDAGCNDYHAKPVELSRLLNQIEALLRRPDPAGPAPS